MRSRRRAQSPRERRAVSDLGVHGLRSRRDADRGRRELRRRAHVRHRARTRARRVGRSAACFRTDHGGKGSNQAVGAARLGAEVALLTAVGRDAFGRRGPSSLWTEEGVDAAAVLRPPLPTMTAAILVEVGRRQPDRRSSPAPSAPSRRQHVDAFAPRSRAADVLLVQLEIPLATALHAVEVARAAGVRTILNPAPAHRRSRSPPPPTTRRRTRRRRRRSSGVERNDRGHARRAGGAIGDEPVSPPSLRGRSTRRAPATRSPPRSRSRSPRARPTPRRSAGAARPAPTWSSTKGVIPGLPTTRGARAATRGRRMTRLIVDTDTAGDDIVSLLIALRRSASRLEAITVVLRQRRASSRRSRTRSTRSRWPGGAGRCPSTPAAREPLAGRVGGRRVRPRPGRDGRLVLPAGRAAPREPSTPSTSSSAGSNESPAS